MKKLFKIGGVQNDQYEPSTIDGDGNIVTSFDDAGILATFENMNVQPNLTIQDITFRQDGAKAINDYVDAGVNGGYGIFEAQSFEVVLQDGSNDYKAFTGLIDLVASYKRFSDHCTVKIRDQYGLTQLENRSSVVSFAYLADAGYTGKGKITSADYVDVPYVINYIPSEMQLLVMSIILYMMGRELVDTIWKTYTTVVDVVAYLVAGGITGPIASTIKSVGASLLLIAYCVALTYYVVKLAEQMIISIFGDVRYYRTMKIKTMLEKGAEYLGVKFSSTIFDGNYKNLVFLPTKSMKGNYGKNGTHGNIDDILNPWQQYDNYGYPNAQGYGYSLIEIMELCMKMFRAKMQIIDGTLYLEPTTNKAFWEKTIQTMPNIGVEILGHEYNASELKANYLIAYQIDNTDINTFDNFSGTNYERLTSSIKFVDEKYSLIQGLEDVQLPVALGTRKEKLTTVESALKDVCDIIDSVLDVFGASPAFGDKINNRIGMLNLSSHKVAVPKLLMIDSTGHIPTNYRSLVDAETLYKNYHYTTSFVSNDFNENQYFIYKNVEIPFGFTDFLNCLNNSWFNTVDGQRGKFDKIEWRFGSDYAIVDYRIRKIYTTNLKETFVKG